MFFRFILLLAVIVSGAACSNCRCVDEDLRFGFVGFDSMEVAAIVLKKYEKGSRFSKLIDTTLFNENHFRIKKSGDTISFPVHRGGFSLAPRFDWLMVLPQIGKEIKIEDIRSEQIRSSCAGKVQCINPITSVTINGAPQYIGDYSFQLYVKK